MTPTLAERLRRTISEEGPKLRAISESDARKRPGGGNGWSVKQELGHLVDSAVNNRVRFNVAALEGRYEGPTYDGVGWVDLGGYADTPWTDVLETWTMLNRAIAISVERIPDGRLASLCRVAASKPVSLEFLIDDYLLHMQHHLDHIFARQQVTAYPGAEVGI